MQPNGRPLPQGARPLPGHPVTHAQMSHQSNQSAHPQPPQQFRPAPGTRPMSTGSTPGAPQHQQHAAAPHPSATSRQPYLYQQQPQQQQPPPPQQQQQYRPPPAASAQGGPPPARPMPGPSAPRPQPMANQPPPPHHQSSQQTQFQPRPPMPGQPPQHQVQPAAQYQPRQPGVGVAPPPPPGMGVAPPPPPQGGADGGAAPPLQNQAQQPRQPARPLPPTQMRPAPPTAMRPVAPGMGNGAPVNGARMGAGGASAGGGGAPHGPGGYPSHMQPAQAQQGHPHQQAPHPGQQQPAPKLNSSMMPRPCAQEPKCGNPREFYHRGAAAEAGSTTAAAPPASNCDFIGVDDGSAGLRYMRLTTGAVASDPSVMSKSGVPFAVVLSPFADPAPGEAPIPVVDLTTAGGGGPLRCERCNAYGNPGFKFINGGSQFQCNICNHICTTPAEHYSPIAPATGARMDADTRHEFRYGSVEYIVGSSDYCMRPPAPACYVFAFDISSAAVTSGLALAAVNSVKAAVAAGMLPGSQAGARVGILTYDRSLHFYDARGSSDEGRSVSMHVVPDVSDAFVPLGGDAFLLKPGDAVAALDNILEVHGLAAAAAAEAAAQAQAAAAGRSAPPAARAGESALGACLSSIKNALEPTGGKAFVVAGSLPSFGPGKLERRGGAIGGGEEREMGLLQEAIPEYEVLGCEMADAQISVDLFLAPASAYVDAATLVRVPRACGGRMYLFSGFDPVRDSPSLHRSLCSAMGSVRAFEALLRVRASIGVDTTGEFLGHFGRPQRGEDVSGPIFDANSSLARELTVVSKLKEAENGTNANGGGIGGGMNGYGGFGATSQGPNLHDDVCVQAAILFTDPAGKRRIRVHSVFANKTSVLGDVFKHADVDATTAFLAKKAASAVLPGGTPLSKAREALVEKMTQSLFVYRKHCTTAPMSGQLILPEALKVLPVMVLGLTKSNAFRPTAASAQASEAISVDERVAALSFLSWASAADIAAVAYPRMWALHELDKAAGLPLPPSQNPVVNGVDANGKPSAPVRAEPVAMPNTVLLGAEALSENGVLLAENAMRLVVWVGTKADEKLVNDVVAQVAGGRVAIRAETAGAAELTKSVGDEGKRIAAVIQRIISQRTALSSPQVVIRQAPGAGGEAKYLMPLLVEDRPAGGGMSYVEFLRHVHKRVMDKLSNESAQNEAAQWEMLNQM